MSILLYYKLDKMCVCGNAVFSGLYSQTNLTEQFHLNSGLKAVHNLKISTKQDVIL